MAYSATLTLEVTVSALLLILPLLTPSFQQAAAGPTPGSAVVAPASQGAAAGGKLTLVKADKQEAAEASDAEADGCLTSWFCYKLPSGENTVPWAADDGLKYLIIRDVAVFGLSFIGLPFVGVWVPLLLHMFLLPDEGKPSMGSVLFPLVGWPLISIVLGVVTWPVVLLPFGSFAYLIGHALLNYWFIPVTLVHAYNREMRAAAAAERKPVRHQRDDDDAEANGNTAADDKDLDWGNAEDPDTGGGAVKPADEPAPQVAPQPAPAAEPQPAPAAEPQPAPAAEASPEPQAGPY